MVFCRSHIDRSGDIFRMNIYVALIAVVIGALGGWRAASDHYHANQLKSERSAHVRYVEGVKRAIDQADELATQNAEFESASVQRRVRIERVFQTINHEVIRYVQTDAGRGLCFDDDGLRLYNAANRGEFPAPDTAAPGAGGPGGMPGAAGGERRLSGGSPGQPRLGSQGILRLPGTAPGAVGVGKAQ
jgi:hypothetical protein